MWLKKITQPTPTSLNVIYFHDLNGVLMLPGHHTSFPPTWRSSFLRLQHLLSHLHSQLLTLLPISLKKQKHSERNYSVSHFHFYPLTSICSHKLSLFPLLWMGHLCSYKRPASALCTMDSSQVHGSKNPFLSLLHHQNFPLLDYHSLTCYFSHLKKITFSHSIFPHYFSALPYN